MKRINHKEREGALRDIDNLVTNTIYVLGLLTLERYQFSFRG